jgi:hypothetical protein
MTKTNTFSFEGGDYIVRAGWSLQAQGHVAWLSGGHFHEEDTDHEWIPEYLEAINVDDGEGEPKIDIDSELGENLWDAFKQAGIDGEFDD